MPSCLRRWRRCCGRTDTRPTIGNTRRAALLSWFEPLIAEIVTVVESGQKLIELR